MSDNPIEDVQKAIQDGVYVTVGLGVLAFQKLQVQRNERRKQMEEQSAQRQQALAETLQTVEERLGALEERIDTALDEVQANLPEPAAEAMAQVRSVAKAARDQFLAALR